MSTDKPDKQSPLVPVAVAKFARDLSIPGKGMCNSIATTPDANPRGEHAPRFRVEFDLRIRHLRVLSWETGTKPDAAPKVTMIPAEQLGTWEPA